MSGAGEVAAASVYAAGLLVLLFGLVLALCAIGDLILDKVHLFSAVARNLREYTLHRREFWAWRKQQGDDDANRGR